MSSFASLFDPRRIDFRLIWTPFLLIFSTFFMHCGIIFLAVERGTVAGLLQDDFGCLFNARQTRRHHFADFSNFLVDPARH